MASYFYVSDEFAATVVASAPSRDGRLTSADLCCEIDNAELLQNIAQANSVPVGYVLHSFGQLFVFAPVIGRRSLAYRVVLCSTSSHFQCEMEFTSPSSSFACDSEAPIDSSSISAPALHHAAPPRPTSPSSETSEYFDSISSVQFPQSCAFADADETSEQAQWPPYSTLDDGKLPILSQDTFESYFYENREYGDATLPLPDNSQLFMPTSPSSEEDPFDSPRLESTSPLPAADESAVPSEEGRNNIARLLYLSGRLRATIKKKAKRRNLRDRYLSVPFTGTFKLKRPAGATVSSISSVARRGSLEWKFVEEQF